MRKDLKQVYSLDKLSMQTAGTTTITPFQIFHTRVGCAFARFRLVPHVYGYARKRHP
jgi:hypothetical protein